MPDQILLTPDEVQQVANDFASKAPKDITAADYQTGLKKALLAAHNAKQSQSAPQPQTWFQSLGKNVMGDIEDLAKGAWNVAASTPPVQAARVLASPLTGETPQDIIMGPADKAIDAVKGLARLYPFTPMGLATNPAGIADPAAQQAAAKFVVGLKQVAQDNLTPAGWYNHPVGAALNAAGLVTGLAPKVANAGRAAEDAATILRSKTLGAPVTNDKADLLDSAQTLLQHNIPTSQAGLAQLSAIYQPQVAEKAAQLAASPRVRLKDTSFQNLDDLIAEKSKLTANSPKPLQAAVAQKNQILNDPNLFDTYTVNVAGPHGIQQQTLRQGKMVSLGDQIEPLKVDAQHAVAEARGWTPTEDVSNEIAARRAGANDWRDIVATVNPRVGALNEQLAPYYGAKDQLEKALQNRSTPHYGSIGGLVGGALGGSVGHLAGFHPWLLTGVGGGIGASFARNPYQLLDSLAQGTYNAGRGLAARGSALTSPAIRNLGAANALSQGAATLPGETTPDDQARIRALVAAITDGQAQPGPDAGR